MDHFFTSEEGNDKDTASFEAVPVWLRSMCVGQIW